MEIGLVTVYWCNDYLIKKGYQCRPIWEPLHNLPMYKNCPRARLVNAEKIKKQIITIPSSPKLIS